MTKVTASGYERLLMRLLVVDQMPAWTSNRLKRFGSRAQALRHRRGAHRRGAKHLGWLKAELGERLVASVVLHTGPRLYELADGIVAAPISTLWR